ncbi:MAG: class I tRNA ligase family protein [Patescibacteria group bacterium]
MSSNEYTELKSASVWIFRKYLDLEKILDDSLESYELSHSVDSLYKFLWDYYANWYVEYLKTDDTQLNFSKELFKQYIVTLSPYLPFETEVLWSEFFKETTLLAKEIKDYNWSKHVLELLNKNLDKADEFENVIQFIESLRSMRGLFAIDPANYIQLFSTDSVLNQYSEFIKLVGRAEIVNQERENLYTIHSGQIVCTVNIFEYIKDRQAEIVRTQKIIKSLSKQIVSLETQLNNQKFIEKAESEVIQEKRQSLTDRQMDLKQQEDKLKVLN